MAQEAVDFYLKLDEIEGESLKTGHENQIEVLSWSFGCSNAGTAGVGSGQGGAGRVSMQDFNFSKYADKSSPKLIQAMFEGKMVPSATLVGRRAGLKDGKAAKYMVWEMKNVVVSSHSLAGSAGDTLTHENFSLRFEEVSVKYKSIKAGASEGSINGGWNLKTNKETA